jgi:SP family general alpha glucoside:H+ symporter-like MFS transporter
MASAVPDIIASEAPIQNVEKIQTEHNEFSGKMLTEDAKLATVAEHSMGLWQGMKTYRKAVFWSAIISSSIIMEGYDTTLIGSFFGYPAFREKYGTYHGGTVGWQISSPWQSGLNDCQAVGNVIGALANGYFTHKYGHRKVMLVNLVLLTGFIFMTFFAPNTPVLLVGAFLCSIPFGVFATMGPAYAAEVCPLVLRGYLAAFVNLCWAIGQLLSAAILKALVNNTTQWSYRIPFAIQWIWVLPILYPKNMFMLTGTSLFRSS